MARRKGEMREKVLVVLREHDQPQSAYALLGYMRRQKPRLAPTSICRALAALTKKGLVHRLESINAFVLCQDGVHNGECIMAICDDCGILEERVAPGLVEDLSAEAAKSSSAPERHVIEVNGHCAACGPAEVAK